MPAEKRCEVWNPAMIDVGVGSGKTPEPGVGLEGMSHILVDEKLEVNTSVAVGSNDDVCADPAFNGKVTPRERNGLVPTVVVEGSADLIVGALEKLGNSRGQALWCRRSRGRDNQKCDECDHLVNAPRQYDFRSEVWPTSGTIAG